MILLLSALAQAAPVECSPEAARGLVFDARIAEDRAPLSHPELLPGLILADPQTPEDLRAAMTTLCASPGARSVSQDYSWSPGGWTATSFVVSRSVEAGCSLERRALSVSVVTEPGHAPRYRLVERLPDSRIPVGDCGTTATWREETILAGADGQVRVVALVEEEDGTVTQATVVARRASPEGWAQQVILDPAPPRAVGGDSGPLLSISDQGDELWIVAHGDRSGSSATCVPRSGQTVWTWTDSVWSPHTDREALGLLAKRGAWRLASDPGWFLIMSVLDEDEYLEVRQQRLRQLQRHSSEPLYLYPSARFPELNPGFWIVAPAPFPTEAQAYEAKRGWRSLRRSYVKKGWSAPDPCAAP